MLVGSGATHFAKEQGFILEDNDALMTQQTREAYQVHTHSIHNRDVDFVATSTRVEMDGWIL